MPKRKKTPPRFLQEKLGDAKARLVRQELTPFLTGIKQDYKDQLPSLTEILRAFISHLGHKDKSFRGISSEVLTTKYQGVNQIYDAIRKRVRLIDEKPPANQIISPESTPPKAALVKGRRQDSQA